MFRILHLIFALLCGAGMSQFPEFHQQYSQRIGGALDELSLQLQGLDQRAAEAGLNRFDYVRHFIGNDDAVIQGEGQAMLDTITRHERLSEAKVRLDNAPWYMIIMETAFHLEPDLAKNTAVDFVPAIPLSFTGGAHAFIGFFFGYLVPAFLRALFPKTVVRQS